MELPDASREAIHLDQLEPGDQPPSPAFGRDSKAGRGMGGVMVSRGLPVSSVEAAGLGKQGMATRMGHRSASLVMAS
jgi:hypothetical protein